MNYLRIRLILLIYKVFYQNDRVNPIRTTHNSVVLKHGRILRRLTNCLIELSPELTDAEKEIIEQDNIKFLYKYTIIFDVPTDDGCSTHS
jgi:hypothetical protein